MEIIAEIGAANGNLAYAMSAATAAAQAGAHMIKGQMYRRDTLVTTTAETYGAERLEEAATQWDNFEHTLTYEQWGLVKDHCDGMGVGFGASVFDHQAIIAGEKMGIGCYKIASADLTYKQLIVHAASTGKRMIVSTGGSYATEIKRAARWIFDAGGRDVTWLACTLCYPTDVRDANLLRMISLRNLLDGPVGYSDHTEGITVMLRARELGADVLEKHFTVTPGEGGDHNFAVTATQLGEYFQKAAVNAYGDVEADGHPTLSPRACEWPARLNARRSVTVIRDLPAGHTLADRDLALLRPGTGIAPDNLPAVVGACLVKSVKAGTTLLPNMIH